MITKIGQIGSPLRILAANVYRKGGFFRSITSINYIH